ncbi:S-adenosyl-L-methionine-dependent methyltransferase [Mycena venus]|uniref:S-adenosyl-L-methionine-dependent methyltransferase n=1 Tax=Mycena venus TaxID=2733690 RepID=A0A8H6Y4Y1_9AGAR|nr:S-adenosyl-L-methionine-dependent methyltransferase [Mycena venus]
MSSQIPGPAHTDDRVYMMESASESDGEMRRLDELHVAVKRYFNGELSLAPITDVPPRKILDLGCGSGAWAIDAATQFPEAEVIALDISPLPNRRIPANISFKLADLTQELDFEKGTFDIVHARFVIFHVSDGERAVKRAAELVKPGGFLILEDMDLMSVIRTGGYAVKQHVLKMFELLRSRGVDPEIGRKFAGILSSTGNFVDVHIHSITVPFSGVGPDDTTNELGRAFKKTWVQLEGADAVRRDEIANAPSATQEYYAEMMSKDCKVALDLHFCWVRRNKSKDSC